MQGDHKQIPWDALLMSCYLLSADNLITLELSVSYSEDSFHPLLKHRTCFPLAMGKMMQSISASDSCAWLYQQVSTRSAAAKYLVGAGGQSGPGVVGSGTANQEIDGCISRLANS